MERKLNVVKITHHFDQNLGKLLRGYQHLILKSIRRGKRLTIANTKLKGKNKVRGQPLLAS